LQKVDIDVDVYSYKSHYVDGTTHSSHPHNFAILQKIANFFR